MKRWTVILLCCLLSTSVVSHVHAEKLQENPELPKKVRVFLNDNTDKGWYKHYFIEDDPKIKVGCCFTAHNMRMERRSHGSVSIRYKKAEN